MSISGDIEIECEVRAVTRDAIKIYDGKCEAWIPKSQVIDWCGGPDHAPGVGTTSIFISEWLATEKGLV
jgi:hypothetical protein